MKYNKVTRRMFLQGSGGSLLAIPFLQSLLPRSAWGQTLRASRRYVAVLNNFDYGHHRHWFPTLNKLPNQFHTVPYPMHYANLNSFPVSASTGLSKILVKELNPYLNYLNLYRGLHHGSVFGHSKGHYLGCFGDAGNELSEMPQVPTIDNILARNTNFNPSRRGSFILSDGDGLDPMYGSPSWGWDAAGNIYGRREDASTLTMAFNKLFTGITDTPTAPTVHPRRDILTKVLNDYSRIINGRQISSVDKVVLESAMDQFSDLQRSLSQQRQAAGSCTPSTLSKVHDTDPASFSRVSMNNYAKLMAMALRCDVIRSMVFFTNIGGYTPPGIDFHQGVSHQPNSMITVNINGTQQSMQANEYMAYIQSELVKNLYAPLVAELAGTLDIDGNSILYNSLVHLSLEHSTVHNFRNMPTLTAGNAGGAIRSGYYLDYSDHSRPLGGSPTDPDFGHDYGGIPYNRFLLTILQAFGIPESEYRNPDSMNRPLQNRQDDLLGAHNRGITDLGGYGNIGPDDMPNDPYRRHSRNVEQMHWRYFKDPIPFPT